MLTQGGGPRPGRPTAPRAIVLILALLAVGVPLLVLHPTTSSPGDPSVTASPVLPSLRTTSTPPTPGATPVWNNLTTTAGTPPSARSDFGLAYDARDGYTLLFGGSNGPQELGDTWTFHAGTWQNITGGLPRAPGPRSAFGMAYDAVDHYVVLWGGCSDLLCDTYWSDSWKFAGGQWWPLNLTTAPTGRAHFGMTWDTHDQEVVMFGGYQSGGARPDDTWTFKAGGWSEVCATSCGPIGRYDLSLADDPWDSSVVLFGGFEATDGDLGDTWSFAAGTWAQVSMPVSGLCGGPGQPACLTDAPAPRHAAMMAPDPNDGDLLLIGGVSGSTTYPYGGGGYWNYLTSTWTSVAVTSPDGTSAANMAYDGTEGYEVFFGGVNASGVLVAYTWTFGPPPAQQALVSFATAPSSCGTIKLGTASYTNGQQGTYALGTYPVSATACAGYALKGLSATGGITLWPGNSTASVGSAGSISATFSLTRASVSFTLAPLTCGAITFNGTPQASGSSAVYPLATYAVSAAACTNYLFQQWNATGGVAVSSATSTSTQATLTGTGGLTAWYVWNGGGPTRYTVAFSIYPSTCGDLTFNGSAEANGTSAGFPAATYPAVAPSCAGYSFLTWTSTGGVAVASPSSVSSSVTVSAPGTLAANFAPTSGGTHYVVSFLAIPTTCAPVLFNGSAQGAGSAGSFRPASYSASALACSGYNFGSWSVSGGLATASSTSPTTTVTVSGNGSLSADYVAVGANAVVVHVAPVACGAVVVINGQAYADGGTASLVSGTYPIGASPCPGYEFEQWNTSGGFAVSGSNAVVSGTGSVQATYVLLPTAQFQANRTYLRAGGSISVLALPAQGVGPYTCNWSINGTNVTTGCSTVLTFDHPATYALDLWVVDARGYAAQAPSQDLHVTPVPGPGARGSNGPLGGAWPYLVVLAIVAVLVLLAFLFLRRRQEASRLPGGSRVADRTAPVPSPTVSLEPPAASPTSPGEESGTLEKGPWPPPEASPTPTEANSPRPSSSTPGGSWAPMPSGAPIVPSRDAQALEDFLNAPKSPAARPTASSGGAATPAAPATAAPARSPSALTTTAPPTSLSAPPSAAPSGAPSSQRVTPPAPAATMAVVSPAPSKLESSGPGPSIPAAGTGALVRSAPPATGPTPVVGSPPSEPPAPEKPPEHDPILEALAGGSLPLSELAHRLRADPEEVAAALTMLVRDQLVQRLSAVSSGSARYQLTRKGMVTAVRALEPAPKALAPSASPPSAPPVTVPARPPASPPAPAVVSPISSTAPASLPPPGSEPSVSSLRPQDVNPNVKGVPKGAYTAWSANIHGDTANVTEVGGDSKRKEAEEKERIRRVLAAREEERRRKVGEGSPPTS